MTPSDRSRAGGAGPSIVEVLTDPALVGGAFGGVSWRLWRALVAAIFGLGDHLSAEDATAVRALLGGRELPREQVREAWLIIGRRGGKSQIAAALAIFLAAFRPYRLSIGERAVVMLLASDRQQARTLLGYVRGLLRSNALLESLVASETTERIELTNGVAIEIHTASYRAVRGRTVVAAICDEIAFWRTEDSANPDSEILAALRPAMATVAQPLLIAISSPYARRGELWRAYERHFGKASDRLLVAQAPTVTMNPSIDAAVIARAYEEDFASASAEYGAEFRRDIEAFVPREVVEAATVAGRMELPRVTGVRYHAFVDPSGGAVDSMTLAIAHVEPSGRVVLDVVRERKPPFSPEAVTEEFATVMKAYGVHHVTGDRYGGEWPREQFRKHGITYVPSERTKSDIYRELLPLLTTGRCELLDVPRLRAQLLGLERRVARGGKDSIDHALGGHDDLINAAAGAMVLAAEPQQIATVYRWDDIGGVPVRNTAASVWADRFGIRGSVGDPLVRGRR